MGRQEGDRREDGSDEGIDGDDVNEEELDSDAEDLGITEEFTDHNAAWLKPSNKRKLLEDSDEEDSEVVILDEDPGGAEEDVFALFGISTVICGELLELQWVTIVSAVTVLMMADGGLTKDLVEGGNAMLSCLEDAPPPLPLDPAPPPDAEVDSLLVIIVGTTIVSAAVKPANIGCGISAGKTSMML